MQKLAQRKDNTPTDASLVRGNCGLQLNREETLSAASEKTRANNPEVNLPSGRGRKAVYPHFENYFHYGSLLYVFRYREKRKFIPMLKQGVFFSQMIIKKTMISLKEIPVEKESEILEILMDYILPAIPVKEGT